MIINDTRGDFELNLNLVQNINKYMRVLDKIRTY